MTNALAGGETSDPPAGRLQGRIRMAMLNPIPDNLRAERIG
jgi:hypothetical protein